MRPQTRERTLFMPGGCRGLGLASGERMGDYVLESNPALERLIERLRAQGEPPPHEESSKGNAKRWRLGGRSKAHAADQSEIFRGNPTAAGAEDPAEHATVAESAAIAEQEPAVVGDDLWAIQEDPQPGDEMVLVDFDEEPEVFDEDFGDCDEDGDEAEADEEDEFLDLYEPEEPDEEEVDDEVPVKVVHAFEDEEPDHKQIADEDRELVAKSTEVLDENRHEAGAWILDAFDLWKLGAVEDYVVHDGEDLKAFDENEVNSDELIDAHNEDTEDPVQVAEAPYEQYGVWVALLEPKIEHDEPYHSMPSGLSSQLSVNAGRTRARHKKQSPRQRKRSLRKAEQDATKAKKSSMKAAAKSSKEAGLAGLSQSDLRAESGSLLSE
jgi:hypothetical protein